MTGTFQAQPEPVIVLAHGSRRQGAEQVVHAIAEAAGGRAAFLDFSAATLDAVVGELRAAGHERAIVVPLLFTSAFHLKKDVPAAIADAEARHGVRLRATEPIGLGQDVADTLVAHWREANWHRWVGDAVVYAVGSSTPGANEAVEELAAKVGHLLGVPTRAIFATGGGLSLAQHREGLNRTEHREGLHQSERAEAAPTAVLPLFFAPGLLLDKAAGVPGAVAATPLGTSISPVVRARVAALLGAEVAPHAATAPIADPATTRVNAEQVPA